MEYNPDAMQELREKTNERNAEHARKMADAIEKMLDTAANSTERDKAKKELIKVLFKPSLF